MSGAPAWVSYGSLAVAAAAFLTSVATYRKSGPRIVARVLRGWRLSEDFDITLTLNNKGLASVDVIAIKVGQQFMTSLIYMLDFTNEDAYEGPSLPYRLGDGSRQNWSYNVCEVLKRDEETREYYVMKRRLRSLKPPFGRTVVVIELGTGTEILARPYFRLGKMMARAVEELAAVSPTSSDADESVPPSDFQDPESRNLAALCR